MFFDVMALPDPYEFAFLISEMSRYQENRLFEPIRVESHAVRWLQWMHRPWHGAGHIQHQHSTPKTNALRRHPPPFFDRPSRDELTIGLRSLTELRGLEDLEYTLNTSRRQMNILLWVLQVALAWLCIAGGAFQIFKIEQLQKNVASMRALPRGLWAFLGAFSCLAGLGLILPGATHVLPVLTPIAATAVAAESILISAFYIYYGDFPPMTYSVAMAITAAFISYGRFALTPL
jgi:hypothetical protein